MALKLLRSRDEISFEVILMFRFLSTERYTVTDQIVKKEFYFWCFNPTCYPFPTDSYSRNQTFVSNVLKNDDKSIEMFYFQSYRVRLRTKRVADINKTAKIRSNKIFG